MLSPTAPSKTKSLHEGKNSFYKAFLCNLSNSDQLDNNKIFLPAICANDTSGTIKDLNIITVIFCILGLPGNGMVIWLLGFRIKRNNSTTYVMNLAIADFGVLIFLLSMASSVIHSCDGYPVTKSSFQIIRQLVFFTYSSSQFLLATISIDRCVAVLVPLWYRYHRPPRLSIIVSILIWLVSFLLAVIHLVLLETQSLVFFYHLFVNVLLCTPIMVICTFILVIQICYKPKQHLRRKLATAILFTLLFFVLFTFPFNMIYSFEEAHENKCYKITTMTFICCAFASLNSSINPLIYFLVGWGRMMGKVKISMKAALERVFRDEQDSSREEQASTGETHI
ncbi:mas-related G-protein coupled receptor member H isoform X2 [Anolis carolinensis]|uniref:G-protein coupled receptors family 1 profile domain-containing protein n=1 Tax=Anolis carolinensis TaxID=28377 RepID=A0A803T8M9_ANOCA|nr:PREDICTED: mas-related G-protein coupled receptor member H isoform X2 [Anolis carolinensis]XP_016848284.1 PREDICTED: mas-related G-protein coupled receptor member H isoform X2 [Anolis carolinensis]|eukprot:XP_016848283.1 PREDICTED: mas-related G-protein coupled receptor member H isoform X2 [Anolis carolinensis]